MSKLAHWVQAARPLAQANLAAPLLFGQALAYRITGRFDVRVLALVALWGLLDQLFIVFANDYADREHDIGGATKTLFSGGSGVLPEGKLQPTQLRAAAWVAYAALGALSMILAWWRNPWFVELWLAAGLLLWAYSFPPLRLSYRGGGETLQALGVGGVLPLVGYAAQAGQLRDFPWSVLLPTAALAYAGNVTTALPDLAADVRADKRTWAVRLGAPRAAWSATGLTLVAILLALLTTPPIEPRGALGLTAVALLPNLATPRRRDAILRFVFFQGLTTQALLLTWSALLVCTSAISGSYENVGSTRLTRAFAQTVGDTFRLQPRILLSGNGAPELQSLTNTNESHLRPPAARLAPRRSPWPRSREAHGTRAAVEGVRAAPTRPP